MQEIKILAMIELLKICNVNPSKQNLEYINNDFFWVISAQLYRGYCEYGKLYIEDSQKVAVRDCVRIKWNGTF